MAKGQKFEDLTSIEKIAIFCNYIGSEASKKIFDNLNDQDVKLIVNSMKQMKTVAVETNKEVMESMYQLLAEEEFFIFKGIQSEAELYELVGVDRSQKLFANQGLSFEALRALENVDIKTLITFLKDEHPQTIALVMAYLDLPSKKLVLSSFSIELQTEVVIRFTQLDEVSPETIEKLNKILETELAKFSQGVATQVGGVDSVAEMLNMIGKDSEGVILEQIKERDPKLYEEIKKRMFTIEDVVKISTKDMSEVMKNFSADKTVICLKNVSEEVKNHVLQSLSKRAQRNILTELENAPPMKKADVEKVQSEFVDLIKKMESEGKIVVRRFNEEDLV